MSKALQNLCMADDFLFFKVMEDDELCKDFLELIFGKKVVKIERHNQHVLKSSYESRGIRLDVHLEGSNEIFVVEMQKDNPQNLPKRSRYYQSVIDVETLSPGDTVDKLKRSYIIFICAFPIFDRKRHVYHFKNICTEDPSIELKDESEKIFISTHGIYQDTSPELKEYLEFVQAENTDQFKAETEYVKKLQKRVARIKNNKSLEAEYMTFEMRMADQRAAGREEGLAEGVQKGLQKGLQKGHEKGLAEGEQKLQRMQRLCKYLMSDGRTDELSLMLEDEKLREKLYEEYGL